ncbi:hypothetical protein KKH50_04680 [Patescibacteria group bacterium]|nr:hypothetical protein [Patescibacteria group bacterium]
MSKLKSKDAISIHGTIFMADINKFGRDELADVDRVILRDKLQSMIKNAISPLKIDLQKCDIQDTGDGILMVLPSEINKTKIITVMIPDLKNALIEYNRKSSNLYKLKVRCVVHFGEIRRDKPPLTGEGLSGGSEIIITARLLDSELLRNSIRNSPKNQPLCLLVSDEFYKKIIKQELPTFLQRFTLCKVNTKDRELEAWAFDFKPSQSTRNIKFSEHKEKISKKLNDLEGRCIFISPFDIYNYALYKRNADMVPLRNHLETALLLGNKTILHCADPYRSAEVCELLYEYKNFIASGDILFLLGSTIQDISRDYMDYLTKKAEQYQTSGYGDTDVNSLQPKDRDSKFKNKVIDLLELSPILLHRGYKGTRMFVNMVKKDFEKNEVIATYGYPNSKIKNLNLTLYQILYLEEIDINKDRRCKNVFGDGKKLGNVIENLESKINKDSFSRQILMELFMASLKETLSTDSFYYTLLQTRTNILHLSINVGKHTFIECHPERDKNSPYYYKDILEHLGDLSNIAPKDCCGVQLVEQLKKLPSWNHFVDYHLGIMSTLYARRLADLPTEPEKYFSESSHVSEFSDIAKIVKSYWG